MADLLWGEGLASVDMIEFSAENAMVGLLLFWPREGEETGLALSQNFEFLRRPKAIVRSSLLPMSLYVPSSLCGSYIQYLGNSVRI